MLSLRTKLSLRTIDLYCHWVLNCQYTQWLFQILTIHNDYLSYWQYPMTISVTNYTKWLFLLLTIPNDYFSNWQFPMTISVTDYTQLQYWQYPMTLSYDYFSYWQYPMTIQVVSDNYQWLLQLVTISKDYSSSL